ncbi:glucoamylase [Haloferax sp. MBLA0077]|uniref:Glucoamylase n=3 Tax=Haloferacaceae TaxID=1644056 RepID=A0A6G1Z677_9EURY|nr:glucoamylase [Haloferax sp. CBA1149]MRW82060.1 glucoamylase [Haloferax marinisediminis]
MHPEFHLDVLDDLVYEASGDVEGAVPLASDPDHRYPYAYPRDIACITRAWLAAVRAGVDVDRSRRHIVDAARFHLGVQGDDGAWQQRYALDGTDKGIYIQEDNVAHGLRVLSHAVFALDETDSWSAVGDEFVDDVAEAIDQAIAYTRRELYDPNAHLVESTTSIHEGRIESGYTLWVNAAFVSGLRQARRALSVGGVEQSDIESRIDEFLPILEGGVERAFTSPQQVPRRYSPEGELDFRPDVTLFSPYYFGLSDLFGDAADEAAQRAATALEDPRLGGLQRFLGFYRDFEVHQHGGNGPWMQYTAWHAQYRYDRGENARGDDILQNVASYADEDGHIPEHLTTRARFESFVENEWDTGLDFEKEFDDAVLRDVSFDLVSEELGHMRDSYEGIADRVETADVVGFARPLAWCHAEFLTALIRADA